VLEFRVYWNERIVRYRWQEYYIEKQREVLENTEEERRWEAEVDELSPQTIRKERFIPRYVGGFQERAVYIEVRWIRWVISPKDNVNSTKRLKPNLKTVERQDAIVFESGWDEWEYIAALETTW
jgi:hypothetical protein